MDVRAAKRGGNQAERMATREEAVAKDSEMKAVAKTMAGRILDKLTYPMAADLAA